MRVNKRARVDERHMRVDWVRKRLNKSGVECMRVDESA